MTSPACETPHSPPVGQRTVRRIIYLIPAFGIATALLAAFLRRWDWAEGLIFGSGLAWLNFWWMKRGVEAFTSRTSDHASEKKRRGRTASYVAAALRYALIGFALYGIFEYLHVPLLSLVIGLCAFAAATITASLWEILQSVKMRS